MRPASPDLQAAASWLSVHVRRRCAGCRLQRPKAARAPSCGEDVPGQGQAPGWEEGRGGGADQGTLEPGTSIMKLMGASRT